MKESKSKKDEKVDEDKNSKFKSEDELLSNIIYEESELKKWIEWRGGVKSSTSILSSVSPLSMSDVGLDIKIRRKKRRKGSYLWKVIRRLRENGK